MQTAVHTTSVFVFVPLLFICKVKEYSGATFHFINFASDHYLITLSVASVRDVSILGTAKSLILQVLIIVRIICLIFLDQDKKSIALLKLLMKRCVHH